MLAVTVLKEIHQNWRKKFGIMRFEHFSGHSQSWHAHQFFDYEFPLISYVVIKVPEIVDKLWFPAAALIRTGSFGVELCWAPLTVGTDRPLPGAPSVPATSTEQRRNHPNSAIVSRRVNPGSCIRRIGALSAAPGQPALASKTWQQLGMPAVKSYQPIGFPC